MPKVLRLAPWALLIALAAPTYAQGQLVTASPGVSIHRYAEAGQPTMDVRVWGAVRTPGVYQVERDTDLLELLSLAGGPVLMNETPNVDRTISVQLARGTDADRQVIFERSLQDLLRTPGAIPPLQDGDVLHLEVDVRQRFNWRDGVTIFSSLGTLAVIVLNIVQISR
jgi:protein involved in polysaccharide export with SLBB domain